MARSDGQYRVSEPIIRRLDVAGVTNFNSDFSASPVNVLYSARAGIIDRVDGFQISITDTGSFLPSDLGSLSGGLANGIEVVNIAKVIRTNSDLFAFNTSSNIVEYGSNRRALVSNFSFNRGLTLNGEDFVITLSDDLSSFETIEFVIFGSG